MATLTTTITENVVLNGSVRGSTNTIAIDNIVDCFERILTAAHSNTTTIATFASTPHASAGALDLENAKYLRITNLDSTEVLDLAIVTENTNYQVVLTPGFSHILCQFILGLCIKSDEIPSPNPISKISPPL